MTPGKAEGSPSELHRRVENELQAGLIHGIRFEKSVEAGCSVPSWRMIPVADADSSTITDSRSKISPQGTADASMLPVGRRLLDSLLLRLHPPAAFVQYELCETDHANQGSL